MNLEDLDDEDNIAFGESVTSLNEDMKHLIQFTYSLTVQSENELVSSTKLSSC